MKIEKNGCLLLTNADKYLPASSKKTLNKQPTKQH
jgi:hypothetical protein